MKASVKLSAILVIALVLLGFSEARGGLPESLPIGERGAFLDYAVTNSRSYVGMSLFYTNAAGQKVQTTPAITQHDFTSYAEFRQFITENGMMQINAELTLTGDDAVVSKIRLSVFLDHTIPNGSEPPFFAINHILGYITNITSETFDNAPHRYAYAMIPVPNLKWFRIDVGSNHNYSVTYTTGVANYGTTSLPFTPPKEYILPDVVALGEWYSTNGFRGRFTIGTATETKTYTQTGGQLGSSRLSLVGNRLNIASSGGDMKIESSVDLVHWAVLTNLVSPTRLGMSIPVDTATPRRFFKASEW